MPATEARADAAIDAPAARRRYGGFAARAVIGLALIALLIRRYGGVAIVSLLGRERLGYFAATIALYLAGQVMCAWRWQLLAASVEIRGPFRQFLTYYFVGVFTNLFVPGLVGGDAARAVYLGRRHDRLAAAAASVLADRAVGLIALFWFGALVAWRLGAAMLPRAAIKSIVSIGVVALLGFLAGPLIVRAGKLLPQKLARYWGLVAPYLRRPRSLILPLILSVVLQFSLAVCQYLLSLGLDLKISLSVFLLCVPIANVVASLPITLNGLGVREGTYAVLFGMAGLRRTDAVALGLLCFLSTMTGGLPGIAAFLATSSPVLSPRKLADETAGP